METEYQINLTQDEWLKTLQMLADFPFKQSAPVINRIQMQLQKQMRPNGEDITTSKEGIN